MLYGSLANAARAAFDLKLYFFIKFDATQLSPVDNTGIDADFAREIEEHFSLRCMAENHSVGKAMRARDKLISDP